MAKTSKKVKTLNSYTIKSINKSIKPGDCVLMRSPDESKPSYIAKVIEIHANNASHDDHVTVRVQWYYRPEETVGGRRIFHGVKEVFLSDHFDVQSADTIEGTCRVYGFKGYTKLDHVGDDEYFCRFEYASEKGEFIPGNVVVYCKCEMPYNPDDLMVQCDGCSDWFHPACIDMNVDEARRMEHFFCQSCLSDEPKITSHASSRHAVMKVDSKRLRR